MLHFQSPPSVSQKVPVNEHPPGSPTGVPMERVARFQILLLLVSRIPNKSSDKKEISPFSQRPYNGASPRVPQNGAPMETRPFPEPYLAYPSGSPVKEPSLQVPLIELPQRCSVSRALLYPSFKVPGIRAPFQVRQRSPYGERYPSPEPSFTYPSGSRVTESPIQVLTAPTERERRSLSRALLYPSLKVPDK